LTAGGALSIRTIDTAGKTTAAVVIATRWTRLAGGGDHEFGGTTNQTSQTITGTLMSPILARRWRCSILSNGVTSAGRHDDRRRRRRLERRVTLSGNGRPQHRAKDTDTAGNIGSKRSGVLHACDGIPAIAINSPVAGDNVHHKSEAAAGVTSAAPRPPASRR